MELDETAAWNNRRKQRRITWKLAANCEAVTSRVMIRSRLPSNAYQRRIASPELGQSNSSRTCKLYKIIITISLHFSIEIYLSFFFYSLTEIHFIDAEPGNI